MDIFQKLFLTWVLLDNNATPSRQSFEFDLSSTELVTLAIPMISFFWFSWKFGDKFGDARRQLAEWTAVIAPASACLVSIISFFVLVEGMGIVTKVQ